MARYHDIDCDMWEDLLEYSPKIKLTYVYLFSNSLCRPSGLYQINPKTIKHHTGSGIQDLKELCGTLIEYDFDTKEVWVRGKFKRILSGFKNNEKMRLAVKADFEALASLALKSLFIKKYQGALEGLVSPPLPLPIPLYNNNSNERESVREKTFDLSAPIYYLNEKTGCKYSPKANSAIVKSRYLEGRSLEDFKSVIDKKCSQWLTDSKMAMYLRPETLFNKTHFESYLNEPERVETDEERDARILAKLKK